MAERENSSNTLQGFWRPRLLREDGRFNPDPDQGLPTRGEPR